MADNTKAVWRFLRGKGLSPAQAAGVIGSMQGESGPDLNPAAVNPGPDHATGIAQWLGGRKTAAVLTKQLGPQLNHLWGELQGPERAALKALKGTHTPEQAAIAWQRAFERGAPFEQKYNLRATNARKVFNRLGGVSGDASAATMGGSTTTRIPGQTITSQIPTVDKAGFEQARKLAIVGGLIARRNPNSFLLRSGLLNTQEPTLSNFIGTKTVTDKIPGATVTSAAASSQQLTSGPVHSPVGRSAKVIGTPYAGTHTLGNWQSDNAVDISVPVGTPMVALQDGVVVKVRHHPQNGGRFAGDQITIKGANGNEYFYAHGKASVKPGQRIRRGQKLGTTGSANGVAHLHFGQMKGDPRRHT